MGTKRIIRRSTESDLVPLSSAFNNFIIEKEAKNLSDSTLRNYELSYDLFTKYEGLEEATTDAVKLQNIYHWIGTMKQEGLKPSSINHYLRDVRTFLYWCMDSARGYITPRFKVQLIEGQEEQLKLFTDEEIEALIERPRINDSFATWRTWAIVSWVLGTGNRASTICDVKILDVNFSSKEITLGHTKNKKAQIIPLSPALETVLKEYIRIWRKDAPIDGWLFPNVGEEKLTTNALRLAFVSYCNNREVKQHNIHGLRHNFAKGWIKNNGNIFVLQKILGHSTLDMTRRYVKLFSEDIKEDYDKFSPLDTIKKSRSRTQKVKRG